MKKQKDIKEAPILSKNYTILIIFFMFVCILFLCFLFPILTLIFFLIILFIFIYLTWLRIIKNKDMNILEVKK